MNTKLSVTLFVMAAAVQLCHCKYILLYAVHKAQDICFPCVEMLRRKTRAEPHKYPSIDIRYYDTVLDYSIDFFGIARMHNEC